MRLPLKRDSARKGAVLVAVAILALVSLETASAQAGVPTPITREGDKTRDLYLFILALALAVFLVVEVALVWAIVRYRKRPGVEPSQIHGSTALELTWTGIPLLIVAAIFTFSFITLNAIENDADPEDLTVTVQGFQWQWQFSYENNDLGPGSDPNAAGGFSILGTPTEIPTLVIPAGERVEFILLASDVIHSFYVPAFLYKLDLIPGRENRFTITAHEKHIGVYSGQCAEFCGLDHAFMLFNLEIKSRADFDQWVAEQQSGN